MISLKTKQKLTIVEACELHGLELLRGVSPYKNHFILLIDPSVHFETLFSLDRKSWMKYYTLFLDFLSRVNMSQIPFLYDDREYVECSTTSHRLKHMMRWIHDVQSASLDSILICDGDLIRIYENQIMYTSGNLFLMFNSTRYNFVEWEASVNRSIFTFLGATIPGTKRFVVPYIGPHLDIQLGGPIKSAKTFCIDTLYIDTENVSLKLLYKARYLVIDVIAVESSFLLKYSYTN